MADYGTPGLPTVPEEEDAAGKAQYQYTQCRYREPKATSNTGASGLTQCP